MSDCRWGVRKYVPRSPVKEYDTTPTIRGRIVYKDGLRDSMLTFARKTPEGMRVVDHVELDGVRYVPAPARDFDEWEAD